MDLSSQSYNAPRQILSEFTGWFKGNDNHPSTNNRYSISFATPTILSSRGGYVYANFDLETGDNSKYLNFYADSVDLPSKQVTTGSIANVGSAYNYATSSTFSQINIGFTMPRNHKTRTIFERWISIMSNDANQFTDYYDNYVCPHLYIYKWERGGGKEFPITNEFRKILEALGIDENDIVKFKDDQLVGVYDIRNAFPYNIGSMSLSNQQAGLLTMNVGFYYERYRFYGNSKFDNDGFAYTIPGEYDLGQDLSGEIL